MTNQFLIKNNSHPLAQNSWEGTYLNIVCKSTICTRPFSSSDFITTTITPIFYPFQSLSSIMSLNSEIFKE